MGLKRVTKKFLRFVIPTLIVLAVLQYSLGELGQRSPNPFENTEIRCIIDLDSIETLRTGYLTDYNYDLLKLFAKDNSASAAISLADSAASYEDSLLSGSIDILVAPLKKENLNDSLTIVAMSDSTGAWIVKKDRKRVKALDFWLSQFIRSAGYFDFYNRFFACFNPYRKGKAKGVLTPYDDILQEYASGIGWDWKLLASIIWNESRFKINVKSRKGAVGLMQIMPNTAARLGFNDLLDPEENIHCGTVLISRLQNSLKEYGFEGDELTKYTLAAYNAGLGNIEDCIMTASKHKGGVLKWKDFSEYFSGDRKDTLEFKGLETIAYVRVVMNRYDIFRGAVPQEASMEKEMETEELQVEQMSDSLGSDSLGGIDPRDEEAWNEKQEHDHEVRDSVGQKDSSQVDAYRHE
jgi:hypothetical protein